LVAMPPAALFDDPATVTDPDAELA
jgi:hypothetical protein